MYSLCHRRRDGRICTDEQGFHLLVKTSMPRWKPLRNRTQHLKVFSRKYLPVPISTKHHSADSLTLLAILLLATKKQNQKTSSGVYTNISLVNLQMRKGRRADNFTHRNQS